MSHITTGIRKILEVPLIYNTFQNIVGGNKARERHFKEFIKPFPGAKILDIGCGTAVLLQHLPKNVEYVGYDLNEQYIESAREKYGDRGTFVCAKVDSSVLEERWLNYFDIINVHGLLHHLTDEQSEDLFQSAKQYLKKGGYMVTADPVYFEGQSKFARWITSRDRGQNVRNVEGYVQLAQKYFSKVKFHIKHNEILLPYTGIRLVCHK